MLIPAHDPELTPRRFIALIVIFAGFTVLALMA